MKHLPRIRTLALAALAGVSLGAAAQGPAIFKEADLKLGEKLIAQHKCNQCHAQKWTDDGKAIYRPKGRVNTPALLQGMVERCSTQLGLSLFPEEVTAMAAVLNRDHYRFTQ